MIVVPEVGALVAWRQELRDGKRTVKVLDSLWRGACFEAAARDALRDGQVSLANKNRRLAAELLLAVAVSA